MLASDILLLVNSPPTPPAGWHLDPDGSGKQRYWDGTQWTDQYAADSALPQALAPQSKSRSNSTWLIIGGIVAVLVGFAVFGGDSGSGVPDPVAQGGEGGEVVPTPTDAATNVPSKILAAQTDSEFASRVTLQDVRCGPEEVRGSVVNDSSERLDIFIIVFELDGSGVAIDDRLTAVQGLAAGETGRWSSKVLVDSYASCEVVIDGIFAS